MSTTQNTSPRLRTLIVGLGSIGRRHARLISERADIDLILCDRSENCLAEAQSCLHHQAVLSTTRYDQALALKPDIVIVGTPNRSHVPIALEALTVEADVLVEKPISDSLSSAKRLVDHASTHGRMVRVGYMLRFDVGLIKLKQLVDDGEIGQLVGGRALIGTYITLLNAKDTDRLECQNSLIVDYSHEFDFLRWLFGEMQRVVSAVGRQVGSLDLQPDPNIAQMTLQMQDGVLVQVHMDYIQHPQRRFLELIGDRGTISYDFMTGEIRHYTFGQDHVWRDLSVPPNAMRFDDLFRDQFTDLLDCRKTGRRADNTGEDALEALRMSEDVIRVLGHKDMLKDGE